MFKTIVLGASVAALTATPIAASAAPAANPAPNPAGALSLSSASRAGAPSRKSSELGGLGIGPLSAAIIAVGIAVGAVILIDDKESDDSDSN